MSTLKTGKLRNTRVRNLFHFTKRVSGRGKIQTQNCLILEFVLFYKVITALYTIYNWKDVKDMNTLSNNIQSPVPTQITRSNTANVFAFNFLSNGGLCGDSSTVT